MSIRHDHTFEKKMEKEKKIPSKFKSILVDLFKNNKKTTNMKN